MTIFSPYLAMNPSVIADSACPIISTTLSNPTIAVAFDRVVSVFASAQSKSATPHRACDR